MNFLRATLERRQRQRGTGEDNDTLELSAFLVDHKWNGKRGDTAEVDSRRNSTWPAAALLYLLAVLLLHAPGLCLLLSHTNRMAMAISACAGAAVEGVLIFELLGLTCRRIQHARNNGHVGRVVALVLLLIVQCSIYLVFLLGDYAFQDQSGGLLPNADIVVAGFHESRRMFQAHLKQNAGTPIMYLVRVCLCFVGGIQLHLWSEKLYSKQQGGGVATDPSIKSNNNHHNKSKMMRLCLLLLLAAHLLALGAWIPVVHGCVSLLSYALWPAAHNQYPTIQDATSVLGPISEASRPPNKRPNVILLIHESTSDIVLSKTKEARAVTPFLQKLRLDPNFYHFQHVRAVSGNTIDGVPYILAGCLPLSEKGRHIALSRSMATDFKRHGYSTASFSSANLNFPPSWQILRQFFTANFDQVHDPNSEGFPLTNVEGADDRLMAPVFEKWWNRQQPNEAASDNPRFAQLYLFNSHYPYMADNTSSVRRNPYISSFASLDQVMERLFSFLNETGQLNNTIVIGASDHGEYTSRAHGRIAHLNPPVLQVFSYVYMPWQLASPLEKQTLRYNTNQMVSTLDIYAALQHVLTGNTTTPTQDERDHCVTGLDLLGTKIPDDRLVLSWNALSSGTASNILAALSSRHHGLFLRRDSQRNNNLEINFRQCEPITLVNCYEKLKNQTYWEQLLSNFRNSSSAAFKETFVFDLLMKEIGRKVNSLSRNMKGRKRKQKRPQSNPLKENKTTTV